AEDGIRYIHVTGVQTCALPIFLVNPRVELRIPVLGSIQTALFIDAGNLWYDRSQFQPFNWRYTVGTGVRIETPGGPLVFGYGFNVARVVDAFTGGGPNSR